LTYIGTWPSQTLLAKILTDVLDTAGVANPFSGLPAAIRVKRGTNALGKQLLYYFNYSGAAHDIPCPYAPAIDLLTGDQIEENAFLRLGPWGVAVLEPAERSPRA